MDCIVETFHVELAPPSQNMFQGSEVYLASALISSFVPEKCIKTLLFSFVPPTSGMFVWVGMFSKHFFINLHFDSHPMAKTRELGHEALEMKLWVALEAGLLVGPGFSKVLAFFAVQLMIAQGIYSLPTLRRDQWK
jgi:aromatic amino acid aminotransferase I